jgi:uncharacterized protein YbjT (DUF2867 family)
MTSIENEKTVRLLLVGATGVVGQQVLQRALNDSRIGKVIAITRMALAPHPKLENPVVDFFNLQADAAWWKVDAVICTLGSTIGVAGSQTAFAAIDRDLPIQIAKISRAAGATRFALNSSLGANLNGNFYLRTKAQAEEGIRNLAYPNYTVVRPSLIDTERKEIRTGEMAGLFFARLLRPLIPKRYRPVKPESIAHALLEGVLNQPGEHIIESEAL